MKMYKRKQSRSFVTALALFFVLWLFWKKIYIIIHVTMPWWGFLLFAIFLFLIVDYLLDRAFR